MLTDSFQRKSILSDYLFGSYPSAPDYEAHSDLISVVDDKLIDRHTVSATKETLVACISVFDTATWHLNITIECFRLGCFWLPYTNCVSTVIASWQTVSVAVWRPEGAHVAHSDLTEDECASSTREVRVRVIEGLANQVSKVDAFTEQETVARSFRWCNSHAL